MPEASSPVTNQLLSALSDSVYQRLTPYLEEVFLTQGQFLHRSGKTITEVYFPHRASVSLVVILANKSTTEIAMVGNEGIIGLSVILGGQSTTTNSVVQIAGSATKLSSQILLEEFHRGEEFQKLLLLYTQAQITQIARISACQSHHVIEQRLARWLLSARDATGNRLLPVTQKLISTMLGVRRASITEAAIALQEAGTITYSRGQIEIVDAQKLQAVACECYSNIKQENLRLLSQTIWEKI